MVTSGPHDRPTIHARGTAAVTMPSRMKKNVGELVQNCASGRSTAEMTLRNRRRFRRARPGRALRGADVPVHACARRRAASPASAPAIRNPAQGNSVNVVRPGTGRRSTPEGRAATEPGRIPQAGSRTCTPPLPRRRARPGRARCPRSFQIHAAATIGRAHHVQDVYLQQIDERAPAEQLRLDAEQEGQPEDLPSADPHGTRGFRAPNPSRARLSAAIASATPASIRNIGAAEAVDEDLIEEPAVVTIGLPRPRVGDVGHHHDHDSDAAQGVEVGLALGQDRTS